MEHVIKIKLVHEKQKFVSKLISVYTKKKGLQLQNNFFFQHPGLFSNEKIIEFWNITIYALKFEIYLHIISIEKKRYIVVVRLILQSQRIKNY